MNRRTVCRSVAGSATLGGATSLAGCTGAADADENRVEPPETDGEGIDDPAVDDSADGDEQTLGGTSDDDGGRTNDSS